MTQNVLVAVGTELSKLAVSSLDDITPNLPIVVQSIPAEIMAQSAIDEELMQLMSHYHRQCPSGEIGVLLRPSCGGHVNLARLAKHAGTLGAEPPIILSAAVGRDHIDSTRYLSDRLIFPRYSHNAPAVAEHVVGLLLDVFKNFGRAIRSLDNGIVTNTSLPFSREINGSTIGLIGGSGNISSALVSRLVNWGCQLVVYGHKDESLIRSELESKLAQRIGSTDQIFIERDISAFMTQLDVLVICCDLREGTHGLVNDEFLNQAKPGLVLVNATRQEIVDYPSFVQWHGKQDLSAVYITDTLEAQAESSKIASFSDLFVYRLLANPEVRDRVIITPHTAGHSERAVSAMVLDVVGQFNNRYVAPASSR